jgi:hypothetical protein
VFTSLYVRNLSSIAKRSSIVFSAAASACPRWTSYFDFLCVELPLQLQRSSFIHHHSSSPCSVAARKSQGSQRWQRLEQRSASSTMSTEEDGASTTLLGWPLTESRMLLIKEATLKYAELIAASILFQDALFSSMASLLAPSAAVGGVSSFS